MIFHEKQLVSVLAVRSSPFQFLLQPLVTSSERKIKRQVFNMSLDNFLKDEVFVAQFGHVSNISQSQTPELELLRVLPQLLRAIENWTRVRAISLVGDLSW